MTPSVINRLPAMGFDLPKPSFAAAGPASTVVRRGSSSLTRVIIVLSWIVGITGSFLTGGIMGMFAADLPPIQLRTLEDLDAAIELPMEEAPMGDLLTLEASADQPAETAPMVPVEIPETIETPPENLDLPQIAKVMTMKDIFAVPIAPKIEDALRPIAPLARPKPVPSPRTTAAPGSSVTRSGSSQGGTAGGGGSGGGIGGGIYRPQPSYPEFARSAGMQGTVRLSISVGPSGAIESVSVINTTGFSSLDEYAASHVRRNWRFPPGAAHRYTVPLTFRLH